MEPIKFVHIADLHLGKRQYNLQERYDDFFKVFKWTLDFCIKQEIDFILISGDIFDSKKIGPSVLSDVFFIIANFKNACLKTLNRIIPIICIEGNHDNPLYSNKSWMSFLAELDLIILLSGSYDSNSKKFIFTPYSEKTHQGGMIKIKGTCIYGIPYYGSYTSKLFPAIKNAITSNNDTYNILMMHFGLEGQDKTKQGINISNSLNELHEKIDYLALGHFHKHYQYPDEDSWIFNPGSLETNTVNEIPTDNFYERGLFYAEIDGKELFRQNIQFIPCENGAMEPSLIPNRRFFTLSAIDISSSNSFDETIEIVINQLTRYSFPKINPDNPADTNDQNIMILVFSIKGDISYSRMDINISKLRKIIMDIFEVLDVRIYTRDLFSITDSLQITDNELTIEEIEQSIFNSLVKENSNYSNINVQIVNLMSEIKVSLNLKRPDYGNLKKRIKEWTRLNVKEFETIISYLDKLNLRKDVEPTPEIEIPTMKEEINTEEPSQLYDDFDVDLDDYIDDDDEDEDFEVF